MFFFYDITDSLFQFFQRGGDVLYLIFILGFVVAYLMIEKIWYLRFEHSSVINSIVTDWEERKDKISFNSVAIRQMMISDAATKINKNVELMKVCVMVAPLFGLFGTITGMIEVFYLLAVTGGGDAKAMAGGVSKAIIPPMAGLAVALIGNFAQQYIKNITQRESDMLYHKLVIE
tara:strand:+ start:1021 stop:1545 length:525 start_codon:yes stop_codon:yes gene_type:complete